MGQVQINFLFCVESICDPHPREFHFSCKVMCKSEPFSPIFLYHSASTSLCTGMQPGNSSNGCYTNEFQYILLALNLLENICRKSINVPYSLTVLCTELSFNPHLPHFHLRLLERMEMVDKNVVGELVPKMKLYRSTLAVLLLAKKTN